MESPSMPAATIPSHTGTFMNEIVEQFPVPSSQFSVLGTWYSWKAHTHPQQTRHDRQSRRERQRRFPPNPLCQPGRERGRNHAAEIAAEVHRASRNAAALPRQLGHRRPEGTLRAQNQHGTCREGRHRQQRPGRTSAYHQENGRRAQRRERNATTSPGRSPVDHGPIGENTAQRDGEDGRDPWKSSEAGSPEHLKVTNLPQKKVEPENEDAS